MHKQLTSLRTRQNLSRADVARRAGVSVDTVEQLERGNGRLSAFLKIADVLQAKVSHSPADLAAIRKAREIAVAALARKAGVSRQTVAALESGSDVNVDTFVRIAKALAVTVKVQATKLKIAECPRCSHVHGTITSQHYLRSMPTAGTRTFEFESALVVFSPPASPTVAASLGFEPTEVWELSRLWAPDRHAPDLLTRALAYAVREFRKIEPNVAALVSFADPAAGHRGGIYRAASWAYLGQSEETRAFRYADGRPVHHRTLTRKKIDKAARQAMGIMESWAPGKHRFAKGLTRKARKVIAAKAVPVPRKLVSVGTVAVFSPGPICGGGTIEFSLQPPSIAPTSRRSPSSRSRPS